MSKYYVIAEDETGKIVSVVGAPNTQLVPEGPAPGMPGYSIVHGKADPESERVEHGKIVPMGKQARLQKIRAGAWFTFRKMRRKKLEATDFMVSGDYPLTPEESQALRQKRQDSRDIPSKTEDPYTAIEMFNAIWADTDYK
ncbi:phage tail assembly chaperone [Sulfitobacter sp. R18_1]|uniref:phage tail assembly chaperone n=1 Tax=Sulfitobacter sp. R18_1 TaxID=2821104 RepID=UPI001AD9ABC3|nr:phage tail assembly chaperone [Sulfitobacter sp. R18_1]MBO9430625.1 hypothetical protein [Sulfitobacter sp. R18_1]